MKALAIILVLLLIAGMIGYALLEKRPGYGAYYGLARLTGSRLDIGAVNFATLTRHATPNDALVCPAAHCPNAKPDAEPKHYPHAPGELLARLKAIALAEPGTRELYCGTGCDHTARILQHTQLMRFPDTIDIEVLPAGDNRATLAIYSRSLLGRSDFGVNRARIARWLAALDAS
jgi:uncharacterized protein (DUF1499 family)